MRPSTCSFQIIFMCKTHFGTVPNQTREGWKQYRGTRTFPETKIAAACRPGPNRGQGGAAAAAAAAATTTATATTTNTNTTEGDPGYTNPVEEDKAVRGQTKNAMWPGKVYGALYEVCFPCAPLNTFITTSCVCSAGRECHGPGEGMLW